MDYPADKAVGLVRSRPAARCSELELEQCQLSGPAIPLSRFAVMAGRLRRALNAEDGRVDRRQCEMIAAELDLLAHEAALITGQMEDARSGADAYQRALGEPGSYLIDLVRGRLGLASRAPVRLLFRLLAEPGEAVRNESLCAVANCSTRSLRVHLCELRKALRRCGVFVEIRCTRSQGYALLPSSAARVQRWWQAQL